MKILVMVKQVPDTATQVKIGGDGKQIDTAGITWIVSPYDEFAVEEALRIKEKRGQGEVVAVSLGPDRAKEALRSCLAMGATGPSTSTIRRLGRRRHADDGAGAGRGDQAGGAAARAVRAPGHRRRHGRGRRARWPSSWAGHARPGSWRRRSTPTARP